MIRGWAAVLVGGRMVRSVKSSIHSSLQHPECDVVHFCTFMGSLLGRVFSSGPRSVWLQYPSTGSLSSYLPALYCITVLGFKQRITLYRGSFDTLDVYSFIFTQI